MREQVAEVLSPDKTRLSVNGWFHGRTEPRADRYVEPPRPLHPYIAMEVSCSYGAVKTDPDWR